MTTNDADEENEYRKRYPGCNNDITIISHLCFIFFAATGERKFDFAWTIGKPRYPFADIDCMGPLALEHTDSYTMEFSFPCGS